ncbi:hypothetical protein UA08_02479 [Talaromyces atroroseus]|uniref:FAD/NAD(P)-binding domain-containing protein n=1 Tax=Talaromyces atroroseus TaxID=1441469 RepID=A0A225AL35_TALAT|nr:hypothetical protein UA08_02479 [Talaromyces atroroseus]OKL62252.1 hypothetical protein UA08_02479 [Talaromyces atroroseus]
MATTLTGQSTTATIPSKDRIEPGSVNVSIGKFPPTASSDFSTSAGDIAAKLVAEFNEALSQKNAQVVSQLFLQHGYWRDHLALSWDFHTLIGRDKIASFLGQGIRLSQIELDYSSPVRAPHFGPIDGGLGEVKGVEFFVKFTTELGSGVGIARVAEESAGQWRFFLLSTTLSDLTGHERRIRHNRPIGVQHGADSRQHNWKEMRDAEKNFEGNEPQVVVIGAGQGGLSVAACLKMLGVETLVIDREERVGDNWRNRYRHLVLHDPLWMNHLPYLPFPSSWPVFIPKDKMGDFLEAYATLLDLNVWTKTSLVSSSWDDGTKQWSVTVERKQHDGTKETRTFRPHHVILATGHSGKKYFPSINGLDTFQGDVLCHSSEFKGARPNAQGKKAVVVGCCNSGHDISQDYYEQGYDVTMVQRSSTLVVSSETLVATLKELYDDDGPATEDADLCLLSLPSEIFKAVQIGVTRKFTHVDRELLEGLDRAGFKIDQGPDDGGIYIKYFQRGGGYYINVGTSKLIIDRKIRIKQGQEITRILPHGIEFADGSVLEADEIVFATGYQNMHSEAKSILGDAVTDRIGNVWGYDEEGELRSLCRPSGHPGFWYMGGNLLLCRYFSKLLALQIKAIEEGLNTRD